MMDTGGVWGGGRIAATHTAGGIVGSNAAGVTSPVVAEVVYLVKAGTSTPSTNRRRGQPGRPAQCRPPSAQRGRPGAQMAAAVSTTSTSRGGETEGGRGSARRRGSMVSRPYGISTSARWRRRWQPAAGQDNRGSSGRSRRRRGARPNPAARGAIWPVNGHRRFHPGAPFGTTAVAAGTEMDTHGGGSSRNATSTPWPPTPSMPSLPSATALVAPASEASAGARRSAPLAAPIAADSQRQAAKGASFQARRTTGAAAGEAPRLVPTPCGGTALPTRVPMSQHPAAQPAPAQGVASGGAETRAPIPPPLTAPTPFIAAPSRHPKTTRPSAPPRRGRSSPPAQAAGAAPPPSRRSPGRPPRRRQGAP